MLKEKGNLAAVIRRLNSTSTSLSRSQTDSVSGPCVSNSQQ